MLVVKEICENHCGRWLTIKTPKKVYSGFSVILFNC